MDHFAKLYDQLNQFLYRHEKTRVDFTKLLLNNTRFNTIVENLQSDSVCEQVVPTFYKFINSASELFPNSLPSDLPRHYEDHLRTIAEQENENQHRPTFSIVKKVAEQKIQQLQQHQQVQHQQQRVSPDPEPPRETVQRQQQQQSAAPEFSQLTGYQVPAPKLNLQQQQQQQQQPNLPPPPPPPRPIVQQEQPQQQQSQQQLRVTFVNMDSNTNLSDQAKVVNPGWVLWNDNGVSLENMKKAHIGKHGNMAEFRFAPRSNPTRVFHWTGTICKCDSYDYYVFGSNNEGFNEYCKRSPNCTDLVSIQMPVTEVTFKELIFYGAKFYDAVTTERLEFINDVEVSKSQMNSQHNQQHNNQQQHNQQQNLQHSQQQMHNLVASRSMASPQVFPPEYGGMSMVPYRPSNNNNNNNNNDEDPAKEIHRRAIAALFNGGIELANVPITKWVECLSQYEQQFRDYHLDRYFEHALNLAPKVLPTDTQAMALTTTIRTNVNLLCSYNLNSSDDLYAGLLNGFYQAHYTLVQYAQQRFAARNPNFTFNAKEFAKPFQAELGNDLLVAARNATTYNNNKNGNNHRNNNNFGRGGNSRQPPPKKAFTGTKKPAGCPDGFCYVCFANKIFIKYTDCTLHNKGNAAAAPRE